MRSPEPLDTYGGVLTDLDRYRMLLFWDQTVRYVWGWVLLVTTLGGLVPVAVAGIFKLTNPTARFVTVGKETVLMAGDPMGNNVSTGGLTAFTAMLFLLFVFCVVVEVRDRRHKRSIQTEPVCLDSPDEAIAREVRWYMARNRDVAFMAFLTLVPLVVKLFS